MRVHTTAAAVAALALSASLAAGAAGTAFASVPAGAPPAAQRAHSEQPLTSGQFRVTEELGALARDTGALGRATHSGNTGPDRLKQLHGTATAHARALRHTVARAVARTRPAPRPAERPAPRLSDATERFTDAAGHALRSAHADTATRTEATGRLLTGLASVTRAALTEARIAPDAPSNRPAAPEPDAREGSRELQELSGTLAPVGALIEDVLTAGDRRLDERQAARHQQRVTDSLVSAQRAGDAAARGSGRPADARAAAAARLQEQAEALIGASRSGEPEATGTAADGTAQAAVVYLERTAEGALRG